MTRRAILLAAILLALLAIAAFGAVTLWSGIGGSSISAHGYLAMGLGVLATFALGAGLMFLVFYSNRRGYDDAADRVDDGRPDE